MENAFHVEFSLTETIYSLLESCSEIFAYISDKNQKLLGNVSFSNSTLSVSKPATLVARKRPAPQKPANVISSSSKSAKTSTGLSGITAANKGASAGFQVISDSPGKVDVSSLIKTLVNPDTSEKLFQCSICPYQSSYTTTIKRHVEMKHMPTTVTFPCLNCQKPFKAKSDLKKHYINVHKLLDQAARAMLPT